MAAPFPNKPTPVELEILHVLWQRGPSTVRQVHEVLGPARGVGYTTVLKLMQRMAERGLVTRDESERTHIYSARYSQDRTQAQLVRDLLDRAFRGSARALVMQALSAGKVSPDELREIRKLLDQLQGGQP
jgi:predicted transcriptional regulator